MQNITLGHCVYIKDQNNETNGRNRQKTLENMQETRFNQFRRFTRVYLTIYTFIQQEKLPERREQDYEINLLEDIPKRLNAKAYAIIVKEDKVLNQWLDKQLKTELIVESSSRYTTPCFYIFQRKIDLDDQYKTIGS